MSATEELPSSDLRAEYARLGAPAEGGEFWRLDTSSNRGFKLCPTYPDHFAVPVAAPPGLLERASRFRAKRRLPVLCWTHPNGGALLRGAQPRPGLLSRRSAADEEWLSLLVGGGQELVLFDMRPAASAHANVFKGGGFEKGRNYRDGSGSLQPVTFCGLKNVHEVRRRALDATAALSRPRGLAARWRSARSAARWLGLQSALIRTAVRVAARLDAGASVLIHCSDGWDRTPQVTALAQLLLDGYYRTLRGLLVLIQKEWLAFGHRFELRRTCGQPIFGQFLDALAQLVAQHPAAFEYNHDFLRAIAAAHDGTPIAPPPAAEPPAEPPAEQPGRGGRGSPAELESWYCVMPPFEGDNEMERARLPPDGRRSAWQALLDPGRRDAYVEASYRADPAAPHGDGGAARALGPMLEAESRASSLRLWPDPFFTTAVEGPGLALELVPGSSSFLAFACCLPNSMTTGTSGRSARLPEPGGRLAGFATTHEVSVELDSVARVEGEGGVEGA